MTEQESLRIGLARPDVASVLGVYISGGILSVAAIIGFITLFGNKHLSPGIK